MASLAPKRTFPNPDPCVEHGLVEFALSAVYYVELSPQSVSRRREPIGALIVELSNMRTMAGPDVLIDGVKQAILDPYSATAHNKLITWAPSGFFAARSHALDLRVLGAKDSHASGHQGRPRCRAGVDVGEPLHVGAYV